MEEKTEWGDIERRSEKERQEISLEGTMERKGNKWMEGERKGRTETRQIEERSEGRTK